MWLGTISSNFPLFQATGKTNNGRIAGGLAGVITVGLLGILCETLFTHQFVVIERRFAIVMSCIREVALPPLNPDYADYAFKKPFDSMEGVHK